MKSFYKLPVLTKDPAMGLMVEDGIPEVVDMEGYNGMRGMSEVLSWSTPASEIVELVEIAGKLNASHTGVVRTGAKAGGTCILSNNDYQCLDLISHEAQPSQRMPAEGPTLRTRTAGKR